MTSQRRLSRSPACFRIGLQARTGFTFVVAVFGGPSASSAQARPLLAGALGEITPPGDDGRSVTCSPRPKIGVATAAEGGRLKVTISSEGAGNAIRSVAVGSATNARVSIAGGPTDSAGYVTYTPPAGAQTVTASVSRTGPERSRSCW